MCIRDSTSSFGKEALGSDKFNFSRYHNDPVIWMGDNVTVLHENDKVEKMCIRDSV